MAFDRNFKEDFLSFSSIFVNNSIKPNNIFGMKNTNDHRQRLKGVPPNRFDDHEFDIDGSTTLNPILSLQNPSFDPYYDHGTNNKSPPFDFFKNPNEFNSPPLVPFDGTTGGSGGNDSDGQDNRFLHVGQNGGFFDHLPKNRPILSLGQNQIDHTKPISRVSKRVRSNQKVDENQKKKSPKKKASQNRKQSNVVKGQWKPEEDTKLEKYVKQYGKTRWCHIAKKISGRVGKQCRERWYNHLRPHIKKCAWTEEEEKILVKFHRKLGNKWAEISKKIPGRSENTIKNHWNATKRKQLSKRKTKNHSRPNSLVLENYVKQVLCMETKSYESGSSAISDNGSNREGSDYDLSHDGTIDMKVEIKDDDRGNMFSNCYHVGPIMNPNPNPNHDPDYDGYELHRSEGVDHANPFYHMDYLMEGDDEMKEMALLDMLAQKKY